MNPIFKRIQFSQKILVIYNPMQTSEHLIYKIEVVVRRESTEFSKEMALSEQLKIIHRT